MANLIPEFNENSQLLTRELMTHTLVNEVARVLLSAPTLAESINSYFLGINEITNIERAIVFTIDSDQFCLVPFQSYGMDLDKLDKSDFSLSFMAGEYPDAIFLNRHIIVDKTDAMDPFQKVNSKSYVVMPIISRITSKCWENRDCGRTECPCYQGHNPYCWSVVGAALDTHAKTEDEKRQACVNCPQFKCEAILWLDTSDMATTITAESVAHLTVLNRHMGMVIETFGMYNQLEDRNKTLTRLNEEVNKANQMINRELDHARSIQKGLLPSHFPKGLYRDISTQYIPYGKVGGDYYDCFHLGDDRLGILIADVSGHGIAAALIMSMFKVLLKTFSPTLLSPQKILFEINETFLREINSTNYVTVFYAIFYKKTRKLTYCNAGHIPQILMDENGDIEELRSSGLFVGVLEDIMLKENTITLPEDSRLVLYTDGITESKNPEGVMFGFESLRDVVLKSRDKTCAESLDGLMSHFQDYRQDVSINDDITLMFLDL